MLRKKSRKAICLALTAAMLLGTGAVNPAAGTVFAADAAEKTAAGNIQAEFFVAPTGNDSNPGTYEQPFASLEGARKAVSTLNENMTGDIYVFIMPGTYYVTETVTFNTADSGTNGYEIIYKCLGDASGAQFAGGIKVNSDWKAAEASTDPAIADSDMQQELAGKIYKTNLEAQLNETFGKDNWPATSGPLPLEEEGKFTVNTITVNDNRATLARTLNSQKFSNMPSTLFDNPLYTAGGGNIDMTYKSGDVSLLFINQLSNAQKRGDLSAQIVCNDIGGKRAWDSDTLPITNVNAAAGKLTFNPNDVGAFAPLYTIGGDSRYYLQGSLAFLDTPGEFYYNPETYDLYYYPKDGETNLTEQTIVIPTTDKVINIEGERTGVWDDTMITPVKNIVFDGLKFSDTSFPDYYSSGFPWLPYASGTPSKYAFPEWAKTSTNPVYCGSSERPQFQVGTVNLKYTDNITIENCNIKNAAMNGIELYLGVTNTVIKNCLVEYCGNGGIMIEGGYPGVDGNSDSESYTNHNIVENTVVHDVGQMVHQTFGIQVAHATYNTVTNCEIYNSPRRGILLMGSDVNGWNNTGEGNRNWAPVAYDVKRDEYAHGNTFSNIYLHDVQQDGGDDGGLFTVFVYYAHHNFSRPNSFDQIVIDEIGAQPNMGDIAPNNINLDMGWCGVEMSNIKTVNPQHYTIENSNLQNGQVKVDNCTFYFRNPQDGLDKFDDSRMNYANIGVQAWNYPEEYKHAITSTETSRPEKSYFEEDFEKGLDWAKWSYNGAVPEITRIYMSEGAFNGKSALVLNNESGSKKPVLYREFDENLNKIVTVNIFDRQLSPGTTYGDGKRFPDTGRTVVRADGGTDDTLVSLGIDPETARDYYVMNIGGVKTATPVRRVFGWHELKYDYSVPGKAVLSIDGTEVGTAARENFNYVALGSEDGTGENYYDQLYIYGGSDVTSPNTGKMNKVKTASASNNRNRSGILNGTGDPATVSGNAMISGDAATDSNVAAAGSITVSGNTTVSGNNGQNGLKLATVSGNSRQSDVLVDWKFEDNGDFPYDVDAKYQTPFKQAVSSSGNYNSVPSGNTMIDYFNTTFSVVDNPVKNDGNLSSKVLARSGEGGCHGYAQQDPQWCSYIWEFDYLYKSSNKSAKDNSISFIFNSQSQNNALGSGYPYQPVGYWFTINESTSSLEVKKAAAQTGSKAELAKLPLESEAFSNEFKAADQWHNVQITAKNGDGYTDICISIDYGKYVLECSDTSGAFDGGTFAFNSMGTDFYLDNIRFTGIAESPLTGYHDNFKLGNAVLDSKFDPDVSNYTAAITDSSKEVTLVKPDGAGAEYTISLNGADITQSFTDTVTPVGLPLTPGNNTLTVTELTQQQIKTTYTIEIYKTCTLVSTDIPETMTITVGTMPKLPDTTQAVVNDGEQDLNMSSAVVWDMADQSCYKKPGTFTVQGYLTEIDEGTVTVTVNVDGVNSADPLAVIKCEKQQNPASLLPQTIGMNYMHSGKQQKAVTFKTFDPSVYAETGTVIAVGKVDDYGKDVIQTVEITESEIPSHPTDKKQLQKTYDYAKMLSTDGVTDSAKAYFEKVLSKAGDVLGDPEATQEEINAAWNDLLEGIWGLGLVQGDKTVLKLLIDKADSMIAGENKYVRTNWQKLLDALEAANTVMDDGDAMEKEIQKTSDELLSAILVQKYRADKSILEDLIKNANEIDPSLYTEKSANTFLAVLRRAAHLSENENLSIDDQSDVDRTARELAAAIQDLELKDSGNGGEDSNNGSGDNNGNDNGGSNNNGNNGSDNGGSNGSNNGGNNGSNNNSSNDAAGSSNSTNAAGETADNGTGNLQDVKTGDASNILLPLFILGAAVIFIGVGAKFPRKKGRDK